MSVHTNHGLKAPNTKNYVMDSNQNYWYHIKEQQPGLLGIKRTVYVYSSTWSFVDQFRNYSIGEQGETAPPSIRKATFAAFSASAGGSQPSPCGLANLPLRRRSGPLEFWGNAGAFGKADDDASLAGRRGG